MTSEHSIPTPAPLQPAATILVVDDELANVRLLEVLLRQAGYTSVAGFTDPGQLIARCSEPDAPPDLILLDLLMPVLDGFAVLSLLRSQGSPADYLPILVLTAESSSVAKQRALRLGANDFLTKPFDPVEVLLRVGNLLQTRALYGAVQQHNAVLEQRVRERTAELALARVELLQRLAIAAEYRDDVTHEHTLRVGELAGRLAVALGLSPTEVELIAHAAPLHDIGKLGIPDRILLKPGPLTADEIAVMQTHTTIGARILGNGQAAVVRWAERVALAHHERWNGTGYPAKLRGEAIPLAARIVSVADVFDSLTHVRPYKTAWPVDRAIAEITVQRGQQFDPRVVDAFLGLVGLTG